MAAPLERLMSALTADDLSRTKALVDGSVIALGWATVELDRAAAEFGTALGIPPGSFTDAGLVAALGARGRVADAVLADGISLILLEPATEGRLAASLARLGEGPAAAWLSVEDLAVAAAHLQAAGVPTSAAHAGPFGPERLVLQGPVHGPYRLIVELAGTIRA